MPTVKIVPMPGVPGPQGPQGPRGYQGETGLTGPQGPAGSDAAVADFVFVNEGEEDGSSITISNKDMVLRTTRDDEETDADISLQSADDIFIEAQGDDVSISANNSVRINAYNDNIEINAAGYTIFSNSDVYLGSNSPENQVATVGNIFPSPVNWTPVLSGTGFSQTSNLASGSYLEYGSMIVVHLNIPFSNVTDFGTGQYSIELPFESANHTDIWGGTIHNESSQDYYSIKGHIDANSTTMTLWAIASTLKDEPFKYNYPISLATEDSFHMSFIYQKA